MPFTPRNWTDGSAPAVSAANIEDLETRTTDYADTLEAQHILNVKTYGAVGDGSSDDTAAVQDAIDEARTNGGIVFFPMGTYKITSTLDCSYAGKSFRITGAQGMAQWQIGPTLLFTAGAGAGPILDCPHAAGFELDHLRLMTNNGLYDGDMIDLDGAGGGDCSNWHIHHISTYSSVGAHARSSIRMQQAIIGNIDHCHLGAAQNAIRLGDPSGTYVVGINIENCTFNLGPDSGAHILIGSSDCEALSIRGCVFEAGTNTGAVVVDGGSIWGHFLFESNWCGDSSGLTIWLQDIQTNGGTTVTIRDNFFGSVGTDGASITFATTGQCIVTGNRFAGGSHVFDVTSNEGHMTDRTMVFYGNYVNTTDIFATTGRPNNLFLMGGSYASENPHLSGRAAFGSNAQGVNWAEFAEKDYDYEPLVVGANIGARPELNAHTIVAQNSAQLLLQASCLADTNEVRIAAGTTPTDQLRISKDKIGFYGTAPATKPSLTYSRTGESTAEAQFRTALSTLGLVADNTTA